MIYIYQPKIMGASNINHLQAMLSETLSGGGVQARKGDALPRQVALLNHQQRPLWVRLTGGNHAAWMTWAARGAWAMIVVCLFLSLMGVGR